MTSLWIAPVSRLIAFPPQSWFTNLYLGHDHDSDHYIDDYYDIDDDGGDYIGTWIR